MIYQEHLMIHFGELSTKGRNKRNFIRLLHRNIKHALKGYIGLKYIIQHDHIYIALSNHPKEAIIERLQDVSGIHAISVVYRVERDITLIKEAALTLMANTEGKSFKVKTKRNDKSFPLNSDELNYEIGGYIFHNTEWKVDVHTPDIVFVLEIHMDCALMYTSSIPGAGGYPLGIGGRVMMMMSGGIDSPVAAYLLMKRGMKIDFIHFASPPYTQEAVITKVKDLARQLTRYQPMIKLHIVPFTEIQTKIYEHAGESYPITIMRRMMVRIAYRYSIRKRCNALATGESIGQVASQTLASMEVINQVTNYLILRPLATYDKLDIVNLSKKIGTYDISIRPFEDCCTIFKVKNPAIAPKLREVKRIEELWDFEKQIFDAIKQTTTITITDHDEHDELF